MARTECLERKKRRRNREKSPEGFWLSTPLRLTILELVFAMLEIIKNVVEFSILFLILIAIEYFIECNKKKITKRKIVIMAMLSVIGSILLPYLGNILENTWQTIKVEMVALQEDTGQKDDKEEDTFGKIEDIKDDDKRDEIKVQDISDNEDPNIGYVNLCDLPVNASNDRFKYMDENSSEIIVDTYGKQYKNKNLYELNTYGESIWGEHGYSEERSAYAIYVLSNQYDSIKGKIAVSNKTKDSKSSARLEILGDNKLLKYYDLSVKTKAFDILIDDIQSVELLKINLVYRADDGAGDVYVLLSDFEVHFCDKAVSLTEEDPYAKLSNLTIVTQNDRMEKIVTHTKTDLYDNVYSPDNLFEFNTYGESIWGNNGNDPGRVAFGVFFLNKQYTKMRGIIAVSDKSTELGCGGKVGFYDENGTEIYSVILSQESPPVSFDNISVQNIERLRIELQFNAVDGAGDFYALLSNCEFY